MKKLILFVGFMSIGFFSSAQTMGIRSGLNISSQRWKNGSSTVKPGAIAGMHVGVFINLGQLEKFSTQFEVSYSQFGFDEGTNDGDPRFESQKLNYYKIGSVIKFHPTEYFNIHAGPELGFQIKEFESFDEFISGCDFGIVAGLEIYPHRQIGIGARYYAGMYNLTRDSEIKQFNRSVQFSLIYLFKSKQLEAFSH